MKYKRLSMWSKRECKRSSEIFSLFPKKDRSSTKRKVAQHLKAILFWYHYHQIPALQHEIILEKLEELIGVAPSFDLVLKSRNTKRRNLYVCYGLKVNGQKYWLMQSQLLFRIRIGEGVNRSEASTVVRGLYKLLVISAFGGTESL